MSKFRNVIYKLLRVSYKNICPICEYQGNFKDFGGRAGIHCPECYSLERHRLQWLYFRHKLNIFNENISLLHIAPEMQFYLQLSNRKNITYIGVDLTPEKRSLEGKIEKADVTALPYANDKFDFIVCNHVLEHIPDDKKAIAEIFRVLKVGGKAILQVPISNNPETKEDLSITDPRMREKLYGQHDHVRLYGLDYKQKLESSGFEVTLDDYVRRCFSIDEQVLYGLMEREDLYIVSKP